MINPDLADAIRAVEDKPRPNCRKCVFGGGRCFGKPESEKINRKKDRRE